MIDKDSLLEVIADGLEVDVSDISIDTKASDIEDWDSLGHLNLLMKCYLMKIPKRELIKFL